jgi:hypothetical protein
VAGFVVAIIVMMIVPTVDRRGFYPKHGKAAEGVMDREKIRALMANAPVGALLVTTLGGVAGGSTSAQLASQSKTRHALVLGALLTLAGLANHLLIPPPLIPPPLWFRIVSLVVLIPTVYFGACLAPVRADVGLTPRRP